MQAHFIPSGARLAQENLDTCFLHDANMFAQQGMSQGCTLADREKAGHRLQATNPKSDQAQTQSDSHQQATETPPRKHGSESLL